MRSKQKSRQAAEETGVRCRQGVKAGNIQERSQVHAKTKRSQQMGEESGPGSD